MKADLVEYYTFGSYDGKSWNHFEKRILDITDHYGDGTADRECSSAKTGIFKVCHRLLNKPYGTTGLTKTKKEAND